MNNEEFNKCKEIIIGIIYNLVEESEENKRQIASNIFFAFYEGIKKNKDISDSSVKQMSDLIKVIKKETGKISSLANKDTVLKEFEKRLKKNECNSENYFYGYDEAIINAGKEIREGNNGERIVEITIFYLLCMGIREQIKKAFLNDNEKVLINKLLKIEREEIKKIMIDFKERNDIVCETFFKERIEKLYENALGTAEIFEELANKEILTEIEEEKANRLERELVKAEKDLEIAREELGKVIDILQERLKAKEYELNKERESKIEVNELSEARDKLLGIKDELQKQLKIEVNELRRAKDELLGIKDGLQEQLKKNENESNKERENFWNRINELSKERESLWKRISELQERLKIREEEQGREELNKEEELNREDEAEIKEELLKDEDNKLVEQSIFKRLWQKIKNVFGALFNGMAKIWNKVFRRKTKDRVDANYSQTGEIDAEELFDELMDEEISIEQGEKVLECAVEDNKIKESELNEEKFLIKNGKGKTR